MVNKIEDWVSGFDRLMQIKAGVPLAECSRIRGINKVLFKQALKTDPILVIKKEYRAWRKRLAATLRHRHLIQVRVAAA